MAQQILLNAILDTKDIERKLKTLGGESFGRKFQLQNMVNTGVMNDLKKVEDTLSNVKNNILTAQNKSVFGDTRAIRIYANQLTQINADQVKSLGLVRQQMTEISNAAKKFSKTIPGKLGEVYRTKGFTEAAMFAKRQGITDPNKIAGLAKLSGYEEQKAQLESIANGYEKVGMKVKEVGLLASSAQKPMVNMLQKVGVKAQSLAGAFGTLAAKVTTWLIATTGIFMAIRLIKSLGQEMKALQDAQIRLQRILPSIGEELEKNTRTAMDFAKQMNHLAGAGYVQTIDALTGAAKAGFDFADSMQVAQAALLTINITEIENVDKATGYLIATIRQFNLQAKDSLWILNQWNELAKKTGAMAPGIAEGVIRSGKAWASVGGTLGQLNAVVATTIEQTGESGEKIGTMLKTLSARYADVNRAKSLNNELEKIGVTLLQEDGRMFNSIFGVLGKLAGEWGSLDDVQKASIAKAAVGVRQYSRFLGVVSNFDDIMRALVVSIDSNNSAMTENEVRTKSLDFSLRRLKGAWSELAENTTVINAMTNAVRFLFSAIGALATPTGKIVMAFTAWGTLSLLLASNVRKLILTLKVLHIMNTALAVSTLRWQKAIAGLIVGIVTWIAIQKVTRDAQESFAGTVFETVIALQNSREELSTNTDTLVKYYQQLNKSTDKGAAAAESIRKAFLNVGNIKLDGIIEEFENTEDVIKRIKKLLEDMNSPQNTLIEYAKELKKTNIKKRWEKFWDSATGIKNNKQLGIAGIAEEFANRKDPYKSLSGSLKEAIAWQKKLNDQGIRTSEIITIGTISTANEKLSKEMKINALDFMKYENTINEYADNNLTTLDDYIKALTLLKSVLTDKQLKSLLGDMDDDDKIIKEREDRLLKIIERFYDEKYKLAMEDYEKTKKLNEAMVQGFSSTFTDLNFEGSLGNRMIESFKGLGDALYGSVIEDMNTSITEMLTGPAPKSMAEQIKDAIFLGGDDVKDKILDGFITAEGSLISALNTWGSKLSTLLNKENGYNPFSEGIFSSPSVSPSFGVMQKESILPVTGGISLIDRMKLDLGKYNDPTKDIFGNLIKIPDKKTIPQIGAAGGTTQIDFGKMFGQFLQGAGLGASSAGAFNKEANAGSSIAGGILSTIGTTFFGPVGGLLGGLLGGAFGGPKSDEDKKTEETINYAKQSNKELQYINRNTTAMVEELKNFSIMQDSYYFSFSNSANRGLIG